MPDVLLIDLDNTQIETHELFVAVDEALSDFIGQRTGHAKDDILGHLYTYQLYLVDDLKMGFDPQIMPLSYVETLLHFLPRSAQGDIHHVSALATSVHTTQARLKPGVEEGMARLNEHYSHIYIATHGVHALQQPRIDALPYKDIFKGAFIMPHKNAAAFLEIAVEIGVPPRRIAVIGDSPRSDMHPAIDAGMYAHYIPAANWAARELHGQNLPVSDRFTQHENFAGATEHLVSLKIAEKTAAPGLQPVPTRNRR